MNDKKEFEERWIGYFKENEIDMPVSVRRKLIKEIEAFGKQQRVDENKMWKEWITVRGTEPITLEDIENRIKELKGE